MKAISGPTAGRARVVRLRAGGSALASACRTIRRCTPSRRATPFTVPIPNSYSLRICSNSSTFALLSIPRLPPSSRMPGLPGVGHFSVSKGASSKYRNQGLRDRAIIAVMTYTFARVGAVVALTVEDYYAQKKRWWLRLREKNGKVNEMPCHHKLESYLDVYIEAAGIEGDRKGPLFRAAIGKTKKLGEGAMSRTDVWYMVRRRAADAGIETAIGCHTFRATGITDYLTNGGRIEVAQRMAGHSNAKTTGLYDRRNDDVSVGEVERIGI
jgi:integrase